MNEITQTVNPLDSRQINAFVTLVETGSFAKTARHLSLTQSAISHSIRALESEMGCRLLVKMGKTVTTTEAGEALLDHAQRGLNEFVSARADLEKLKNWKTRRLKIGASSALNWRPLPGVLAELLRRHPRLVLRVQIVPSSCIPDQLQTGQLDCAIGEKLPQHAAVEFMPLFESQLHIVAPGDHRWAGLRHAPLDELSNEPCILPNRSSPIRALIDWYFSREKRSLNCVFEAENLEMIKEMVKAGVGIGILPAWIIQEDMHLGAMRTFALGRRMLTLVYGLHYSRDQPVDLIQSDFRALCAATAKELFAPQSSTPNLTHLPFPPGL